jgi:glycosyltransferase involved in cell wall biosynthesis
MQSLTIIIVGYNEEANIPKLLSSLEAVRKILPLRIIYIDQSSIDRSVELLWNTDIEIIIRENKWYADPDKKWAVETLIPEGEYCLLIDADEEISVDLAREMSQIEESRWAYLIPLSTFFLGRRNAIATQLRLFTRDAIEISDTIHEYIRVKDSIIPQTLKSPLINIDLKMHGSEIEKSIEKINRYTSRESRDGMSRFAILTRMAIMPGVWFLLWGIRHRNFAQGIPWLIWCGLMAYYQFVLYAKLYEEWFIKDKKCFKK